MNDVAKLGVFTACVEHGVSPDFIPQVEGAFDKLASEDAAPIGRLLLQGAFAAMNNTGYGGTAPGMHIKLAALDPIWTDHSQELADQVSLVLELLEPMEKKAFEDLFEGLGTGARTLGYGAVGAGAGLGSLLWLLNRHSNQENADQESLKKQIDYYHNLSKELHESLKRKYGYGENENATAGDGNDQAEGITTIAR